MLIYKAIFSLIFVCEITERTLSLQNACALAHLRENHVLPTLVNAWALPTVFWPSLVNLWAVPTVLWPALVTVWACLMYITPNFCKYQSLTTVLWPTFVQVGSIHLRWPTVLKDPAYRWYFNLPLHRLDPLTYIGLLFWRTQPTDGTFTYLITGWIHSPTLEYCFEGPSLPMVL